MYKFIHLVCVSIVFGTFSICFAADDPSIQGAPREKSQAAMNKHVGENSYNDHYIIYDAVDGKLRRLKFKELHSGLVKKGDFYVNSVYRTLKHMTTGLSIFSNKVKMISRFIYFSNI